MYSSSVCSGTQYKSCTILSACDSEMYVALIHCSLNSLILVIAIKRGYERGQYCCWNRRRYEPRAAKEPMATISRAVITSLQPVIMAGYYSCTCIVNIATYLEF